MAKASDRNPVFTPRQWLERFKQFVKRGHKIDKTPLLKGEEVPQSRLTGKELQYENISFRGGGLNEAVYQTTRAEYKTTGQHQNTGFLPNTTYRNER